MEGMVRAVGIEPTLCFQNQILSLARLPVPPRPRHHAFGPRGSERADYMYCAARVNRRMGGGVVFMKYFALSLRLHDAIHALKSA